MMLTLLEWVVSVRNRRFGFGSLTDVCRTYYIFIMKLYIQYNRLSTAEHEVRQKTAQWLKSKKRITVVTEYT